MPARTPRAEAAESTSLGRVARFGDANLRVFDASDGVPQSTVIDACFDGDGYLWIGTEEGPARYDGRSWKPVTLPRRTVSSLVRGICATRDRSVWFGTHGGGLYRLHEGDWTVYDAASSALPDDIVITVHETVDPAGRSTLWAGTRRGLAVVEGGRWRIVDVTNGLPNDVVMCVLESTDDVGQRAMWVGTRGGLARYERGRWSHVTERAGLACDSFLSLAETTASDGRTLVWGGTTRGGLVRFDGDAWSVFDVTTGLPDNRVYCLEPVADRDGTTHLWVGTQRGLVRIDERGKVVGAYAGEPAAVTTERRADCVEEVGVHMSSS
mgnify:CR=1 FL=1